MSQSDNGYWRLVDPIWDSISIYDGAETFLQEFREVPPAVGNLLAGHWCQSEVDNGGLHQFFWNSTGVLAPEAVRAFRAIGLIEWADIVEEAMSFFGQPYPREQADRQKSLTDPLTKNRKEWDPFIDLDNRFYETDHDQWEQLANTYAAKIAD